jgi:ELWxxDGT repeat protein
MARVVPSVFLFVSALIGSCLAAAAGTAELVADINQVPTFEGSYGAREPLIPLGDRLLFSATEPSSGTELWISDATPQGTRLLLDFEPGGEGSLFVSLGTVGQTAVLLRLGDLGTWALWRSDGTAAGTFPLDDLRLDSCIFAEDYPEAAGTEDGLFFLARNGLRASCGLRITDGTAAGTRLVEDLGGEAGHLVAAGNRVFFVAGSGLWTSDGDGATLLRSFESEDSKGPRQLYAAGSRVVFIAQALEGGGEELWTSDGTAAGTRALTDFFEPFPFGFGAPLLRMIGQTLYFTADDGTGIDLWRIEGSNGTPRRVTDFVHTDPFPESFDGSPIAQAGNRLVFPASEDGRFRSRLWVSGGTPESTVAVDGCPEGCPGLSEGPLIQLGSRIVFAGIGPRDEREIWVTDGTGAGTRRLADIDISYTPVVLLGKVFFIGPGNSTTYGLWKTDGTAAGTVPLADLGSRAFNFSSSNGFSPVAAGGRIFFLASLEWDEPQLWVSDGSPEGTRAISYINESPGSYPREFTPFAAGALFSAYDGNLRVLWRTDGTAAGTHPIPAVIEPLSIVPASGGVAFILTGYDRFGPFRLWRTDGTEAGTLQLDPAGGEPQAVLEPFRNGVIFGVKEEDRISLWESDGTGTRPLFDLPADVVRIHSSQILGSLLYFVASREQFSDNQLWVSDGTAAGTRPVDEDGAWSFRPSSPPMEIAGGIVYFASQYGLWAIGANDVAEVPFPKPWKGSSPTDLMEFRGALYFLASHPETAARRVLWRSDGTSAFLVESFGLAAIRMVRLGDRLLLVADDGTHGIELWSSDGTEAGTVLVRDIAQGEASGLSSSPNRAALAVAGGKVYFSATDGTSGFELWESDGTAAGTRRVQDIAPGALSSHPAELRAVANRLFFSAGDSLHGEEPWVLSLESGCVPSALALCLGGRFRVEADWRDFQGNQGRGKAVPLTADTGTFWFFDAANIEVILKVLDGRGVNGHHWVFYGALSSVQYNLTVTDTQNGAVRRYFNPPGWLGSLADTDAFGPRGATAAGVVTDGPIAQRGEARVASRTVAASGSCVPGPERLCLNGNRFAVEAKLRRPDGSSGAGRAVPLAGGDTGYLWFFDPNNVEVVIKVLDGRAVTGKFWVFYGALSDVEYMLTVTDTETGAVKTYTNPKGRLASVADTGAF